MPGTDFKTVDEYIVAQPEAVRETLEAVRAAIRTAVPDAEETISYQMPAYKWNGSRLFFFAGWKNHFSLYPAPGTVLTAFKDELAPYEIDKGTIRFPLSQPVPVDLIERIAAFRAAEVASGKTPPKPPPD